ncbi:DUF3348 domain-containing protein [Paraburkholderia edwinii]|uniref:DUF3348 domain-containing protein n=1 Tax=Paraburkholderia edwinii TaxID=2861782 RepID=A0ABX8UPJ4_9BURK|nr:DUF3348 family protein [Paraburkholderia edwinii]QYD70919.1 DUF3348 domain-containing protein [Paraburkholderia edwinii]
MPYSGAPLVRVLTRIMRTGVPASDVSLLDRLSQWLGWTDAIALSSALDAAAPASATAAPASVTAAPGTGGEATIATLEAALCVRTRATLTDAIGALYAVDGGRRGANARRGDTTHPRGQSQALPHVQSHAHLHVQANVETRGNADAEPVDFALFRQDYHTQQQSMEHAIGELRVRLRATLATRSERHARLALVDATMERALDARERSVLGALPALLEAHFKRLRDVARAQAEANAPTPSEAAQAVAAPRANAWLDLFREDMRAVLLAELDVRFQPVEGLLAALRAS